MSKSQHLTNRNGVFYYRRRVPTQLVELFGKPTVQYSLNTTDPKEAKRLRTVHDIRWDAQFDAANGSSQASLAVTQSGSANVQPLTEPEIIQLVQAYVEQADARGRRRLAADPPSSEAERADMRADAEIGLAILKNRDDTRADEQIYLAGEKVLEPAGISTDADAVVYAAFAEWVRRGLLELSHRQLGRMDDEHGQSFFDQAFNPIRTIEVTFGAMTAQFLQLIADEAAANKTSQKWVDKQRANVALLLEIIGEDTAVRKVDYDKCQDVRKLLANIPAHRSKLYRGLSLQEAVQSAQAAGKPILSPTTQDQYLATLRGILRLALKKRIIGVNPAEGIAPLKKEKVSASDRRLPFTPEQLKRLFEGHFYRKCAQQVPPYTADKTGWRFWLPLLCLYMGVRPNEVCQMNAGDVRQTPAGTWHLDIASTDDDDDGESDKVLKTTCSRRRIPIHSELQKIGFLEFAIQRQQADPKGKLFPNLKPDRYGNYAKYPLKRFREAFLPLEIELDQRQSFYSFRHNFRDALRSCGATAEALQALGGWSQPTKSSDTYGDAGNPDFWAHVMSEVKFKSLDLTHLHAS